MVYLSRKLSFPAFLNGMRALLPVCVMVLPFGVAYAVAAHQAGLGHGAVMAKSLLIFAGASQFAVLELWGVPSALLPMILVVFALNSRHILMGSVVHRHVRDLNFFERVPIFMMMTDANWAMASRVDDPMVARGLLFGGGLCLWLFWAFGTGLGLALGSVMPDPRVLGLDAVLVIFFLLILSQGFEGRESLIPWCVAAFVGWLSYTFVSTHWYIVLGAVAGGIAGAVFGCDDGDTTDGLPSGEEGVA